MWGMLFSLPLVSQTKSRKHRPMTVKTLILKTAGINCDEELAHAFRLAGSDADIVHINELVRGERSLAEYDILGFPGGFSYGDDISAGRILATEVTARLIDDILAFHQLGGLIIGICNGFQALVKARLLPDPLDILNCRDSQPRATVFWNDSGKFEDRWTTLRVEPNTKCIWTKDLPELVEYPVAHAEGKFIPASDEILDKLGSSGQIVFRFCDPENPDACERGQVPFPLNPNGSIGNITGICDPTGRILGLMPHPERFTHPTNHPRWTRLRADATAAMPARRVGVGESGGRADGLPLFRCAVEYIERKAGSALQQGSRW